MREGFSVWQGVLIAALVAIIVTVAVPGFAGRQDSECRSKCLQNLRAINVAKRIWAADQNSDDGAAVAIEDLLGRYLESALICPKGGTYLVNPVGADPMCSDPEHTP